MHSPTREGAKRTVKVLSTDFVPDFTGGIKNPQIPQISLILKPSLLSGFPRSNLCDQRNLWTLMTHGDPSAPMRSMEPGK